MELEHIRIENFRNLQAVELEPGRRFNVLAGPNGQGKTNLLEAVYTLGAVKSVRAQRNAELIQWGSRRALLEGAVVQEARRRTARVEITPNGKRVALNGLAVRNLGDYFGTLNCVVFAPDDLLMLKGGPSERRRFLDRAVFNTRSGYLGDVQAYEAVLKQRNAFLKTPNPSVTLMEVYDEQLAEYGASIIVRRLEYLREFQPLFIDTFCGIFAGDRDQGGEEVPFGAEVAQTLGLFYTVEWLGRAGRFDVCPTLTLPEAEPLRGQLREALRRSLSEDARRGFTSVGPHRDDLELALSERDVRTFASQGQTRAIVLAMKIAEIRVLTERFHYTPVLLLDDVSSELDRFRNRQLFEMLKQHPGQVFITTTHRDHIQLEEDVVLFGVRGGEIVRVGAG